MTITTRPSRVDPLRVRLATDDERRAQACGPLRVGDLGSERTFGPRLSFHCACGRHRAAQHGVLACEACGVEVIDSDHRRTRVAYLELPDGAFGPEPGVVEIGIAEGRSGDSLTACPPCAPGTAATASRSRGGTSHAATPPKSPTRDPGPFQTRLRIERSPQLLPNELSRAHGKVNRRRSVAKSRH